LIKEVTIGMYNVRKYDCGVPGHHLKICSIFFSQGEYPAIEFHTKFGVHLILSGSFSSQDPVNELCQWN